MLRTFDYERFKASIAQIDPDPECPVCGSNEMKVDERGWVMRSVAPAGEAGELADPHGPFQPLGMVVCLQCGFIRLHAVGT